MTEPAHFFGERQRGQVSAIATIQLRQWEAYAKRWPVSIAEKGDEFHMCCDHCGMTLIPLTKDRIAATVTYNVLLSMLVAHLRNVHREVEADVYAQ